MPAPIGVECPEQAVSADRLGQAEEARHGAFLFDQERRIDRSGGVVEGDDEIEIAPQRRNPAMGRAVLEQQHSRQRPAQPLLGVPGMDPGLEVQVLCGASWKQPQAEGNCTQVGRRETIRPGAARPCGEEAGGALQHRT